MAPSFASMDTAHLHLLNAKLTGDRLLRYAVGTQFSNPKNVNLGKLAQGVLAAAIMRPVRKLVGHILRYRSPSDMMRRAASFVALAAEMSGVMKRGRGRTVNDFANDDRNVSSLAIVSYIPVASTGERVRPSQALRSNMLEDNVMQKGKRLAMWRLLAAFFFRAYTGSSHLSLLSGSGRLERVAMFQHSARSLFVRALRVSVQ